MKFLRGNLLAICFATFGLFSISTVARANSDPEVDFEGAQIEGETVSHAFSAATKVENYTIHKANIPDSAIDVSVSGGTLFEGSKGHAYGGDASVVYATASTKCNGCTNQIKISFGKPVALTEIEVLNGGKSSETLHVVGSDGETEVLTLAAGKDALVDFSGPLSWITVTGPSTAWNFAVDDIKFTQDTTPEPGSLGLLIMGMAMFGAALYIRRERLGGAF